MTTLLPRDADNIPIPALRLKDSAAHVIAAGATSARNATAFDAMTTIVGVYATVPVLIRFGDAAVTATGADHYFPAGVYYDFCIGNERTGHSAYLAVLAADETGTVYVSEKE